MTDSDEIDTLSRRLRHLLAVEGYGRGFGLAGALRPRWAAGRVPALAVCRTTARLRSLDFEERAAVLAAVAASGVAVPPELGSALESSEGEPPFPAPLASTFEEALLPDEAEINARMAQWTRRLGYLIRDEGLAGEKTPALRHADAAQRLLRHVMPGPAAYLLDAIAAAADPVERAAWLDLLRYRYATKMTESDSDDVAMGKVARWMTGYSGETRGLAADVITRLTERGLWPSAPAGEAP